jgi:quercetin dioxygenase-like cupin family protein
MTDPPRRATPRPTYDEPTRLAASDNIRHIWGDAQSGFVIDRVHLSSERLHVLEFALPPGGRFGHSPENPTIFAADELLYVLDGDLLLSDPSTGETQRISTGDAAFFRRDTWHHGRAGGSEGVRVLEFFSPTPATGASSAYAKSQPFLEHTETVDERILGAWPVASEKLTAEHRITPVRETDVAWALVGETELEFFASTEHLTVMRSRLRAGAASQLEQHPGEEFVFLLAGELTLLTPTAAAANCLFLKSGDSAVIPPDTPHAYLASGDEEAIWLTGIGPGWAATSDIGSDALTTGQ